MTHSCVVRGGFEARREIAAAPACDSPLRWRSGLSLCSSVKRPPANRNDIATSTSMLEAVAISEPLWLMCAMAAELARRVMPGSGGEMHVAVEERVDRVLARRMMVPMGTKAEDAAKRRGTMFGHSMWFGHRRCRSTLKGGRGAGRATFCVALLKRRASRRSTAHKIAQSAARPHRVSGSFCTFALHRRSSRRLTASYRSSARGRRGWRSLLRQSRACRPRWRSRRRRRRSRTRSHRRRSAGRARRS